MSQHAGLTHAFLQFINRGSIVTQILIGLVLGAFVGAVWPNAASSVALLGNLFVGALKAVAPVLVLVLVAGAIAHHKRGSDTRMGPIIVLYLLGTFLAAVVAVVASFLFPVTIQLQSATNAANAPGGITEVLTTLLMNVVDNPIRALANANYIGILAWAIALGIALRHAHGATKNVIADLSLAISFIIKLVIRFAPVGIFGLVAAMVASAGLESLLGYARLLALLLGCMVFVALVVNPLLVFLRIKQNPYPLVFTCLRESGLTAFFTRSSAANIPVNMALCKRLGLPEETYSISIPLGATINMAGAAVTITVLTLAAVHTLGIDVDIPTAVLLSVVAAVCACGASGVAGGSLLLIPLACSLFGISDDVAMQVVGVGFVIGVLQDSTETALNSSTDVLFTAAGTHSANAQPAPMVVESPDAAMHEHRAQ